MLFYVLAHLQPPELDGLTLLEATRITLIAVYWDTRHRSLLDWGHTVRHRTASDGSKSGWTVKLSQADAKKAFVRDEIAFDGYPRQPPGKSPRSRGLHPPHPPATDRNDYYPAAEPTVTTGRRSG